MAKLSPYNLNYGHFGQAIYSIENGAWVFDREPSHRGALHKLGSWKLAIQQAKQLGDATGAGESIRVNDVRHAASVLCRVYSELLPALDLLPELALASAAVTSTASTYDPAIGDLLSFGSFTAAEGNPRPARRIVAVPTGEAGNILLLIPIVKERQGWGRDKSVWLELPSFSDTDKAYWAEEAGPIQQVCFAQSEARAAFLAVRFPTKTVLFRPVQHDRRNPASRSRFYHLPASRIDPHVVLSISCEKTGGSSHADVTFNPDYQRQLGIVDRKSKWSVWDIEGGQRGSKYSITCVAVGLVTAESDEQGEEARLREDGWARILWVGDVNTVVVCNRRRLQGYGLKGGETVALDSFQPVQQHSADWILDIRKHDTNPRHFFLLTSSHLYLLAVICQNDVLGNSDLVPGVVVVLSWAHFRGMEDITLQLHVPALSHEDSKVFLFSRLNNLITVYQFRTHEAEPSRPFSSSDPMSFSLDGLLDSSQVVQHLLGLHLERLSIREEERRHGTGPGSTYIARDVEFYRLCVMLSDRSVHQAIFYAAPLTSGLGSGALLHVEAPTWAAITQTRVPGLHSGKEVEDDDDFIIPNGMETGPAPALMLTYRTRTSFHHQRRSHSSHEEGENTDLTNFELIYGSVAHGARVETGDYNSDVEDISVTLDRAKAMLDQAESEMAPGTTLLESAKAAITVSDVDDASSQLHNLFMRQSPQTLVRIASQRILQCADNEEALANMSSIYDGLLETWIAPLPTSVPNRLRQSKERLARRVAAEVTLANSRIRAPASIETSGSSREAATSSQTQTSVSVPPSPLPVESVESLPDQRSMSTPLPSSQPLTDPTSYAGHTNPITRLAQHLQITKLPPTISPNVNQVLMHWVPAADPTTYDWAATTRAVDEEFGITQESEDLSQKEREKLKRKAERLLKRQKRELNLERRNAESQPVLALRSSPPPIVGLGMSSQTQPARQSQADSQGFPPFGFGVVQSQVELGRHGGRPAIKKKKKAKGRISGF